MDFNVLQLGAAGGLMVRQLRHAREYYDGAPGVTGAVLAKDASLRWVPGLALLAGLSTVDPGLIPIGLNDPGLSTIILGLIAAVVGNLADEVGLKQVQKNTSALQKVREYGGEDVRNLLWWLQDHLLVASVLRGSDGAPAGDSAVAHAKGLLVISRGATTRYRKVSAESFDDLAHQAWQVAVAARAVAENGTVAIPDYARELTDLEQRLFKLAEKEAGRVATLIDLPVSPDWVPQRGATAPGERAG